MTRKKAAKAAFNPFSLAEPTTPPAEGILRVLPDGRTLEIVLRLPLAPRAGKSEGVVTLASTGTRFVPVANEGMEPGVETGIRLTVSARRKK